MTQRYWPFDAGTGAEVREDQWRQMAREWLFTGVMRGQLSDLAVSAAGSGMSVSVAPGRAWVNGHFYESDASETLPVSAADLTNPRVDRVVVRADFVANSIGLAVVQGVPAASPTRPNLTQNDSIWEVPLAQVTVAAAATVISAGNVSDERGYSIPIESTSVSAAESTTSTSFTDLATVGPSATFYIDEKDTRRVVVTVTARLANSTTGGSFMGFEISGGTVIAPADAQSLYVQGGTGQQMSASYMLTGLNRGIHTIRAKYRASAGTATFTFRHVMIEKI